MTRSICFQVRDGLRTLSSPASGVPARSVRRAAATLITAAGFLAIASCSGGRAEEASDARLRVVTTTSIIGDIVRQVAGPDVAVTSLMGPGIDPHLYKASAGDVQRIAGADIVFYNGLHLEARMGDVFAQMQSRVRTVAVAEAIPRERLLSPPEFGGAYDPHVWFDVSLWTIAVERVRDALAEADSAHAATYGANAAEYLATLDTLHRYVLEQAERVHESRRVLVTAHDAFNYFGRAYGFQVRGLQGISTATEAGTADVSELAEFVAQRRIPAIFVESSISPRTVEAVQAAVRARGFETRIGGELFSDALGDLGTAAGSYVGMVRHNIDTIVRALLAGEPIA